MTRKESKEQLVRIKWVFLEASKREGKDDDINLILLVQILDFAVESFLKLVIQNFPPPQDYPATASSYFNRISKLKNQPYSPKLDFRRAWDEVVGIIRDPQNDIGIQELPLRRAMELLHEIRNDIQHNLMIPHPKEAAKYIPLVEEFLTETYQGVFAEDFKSVSHLDLIKNEEIKNHLVKAHEHLEKGELYEAVKEAAITLYIAFESVNEFADISGTRLESRIQHELRRAYDARLVRGRTRKGITPADVENLLRGFSEIIQEIGNSWEQITAIGCGIDYVEYLKYKKIMPQVYRKLDGFGDMPTRGYTEDEAKEIISSVETQVLRIQTAGVKVGDVENGDAR